MPRGNNALETQAIQVALDQAALMLAVAMPPDTWALWVVYLLRMLEGRADSEAYTDSLEGLQTGIARYLDTGQW